MSSNIIIVILIVLIILISLAFYQCQYGKHWICAEDNKCERKTLFGNFKTKEDCLNICKTDTSKEIIEENFSSENIEKFSITVPSNIYNQPQPAGIVVAPTEKPQPTPTKQKQQPTEKPQPTLSPMIHQKVNKGLSFGIPKKGGDSTLSYQSLQKPDYNTIRPRYVPQLNTSQNINQIQYLQKKANKTADTKVEAPQFDQVHSLNNAGYSGLSLK